MSRRVFRVLDAACALALVGCATVEPLDTSKLLLDDGGVRPDAFTPPIGAGAGGFAQGTSPGPGDVPPESGGAPFGAGGDVSTPPPAGAGGSPLPTGSGGALADGSGGSTPSGSGGSTVASGGTDGAPCANGQKSCNGTCTLPTPSFGCGLTGCDPCTLTAPAHGYLKCTGTQCDFDCFSGYTKSGNQCTGSGSSSGSSSGGSTGGSSSSGSTGGSSSSGSTGACPTSPAGCPSCGAVFGPGCCAGSKCGCSPIPWTAGFLGCI